MKRISTLSAGIAIAAVVTTYSLYAASVTPAQIMAADGNLQDAKYNIQLADQDIYYWTQFKNNIQRQLSDTTNHSNVPKEIAKQIDNKKQWANYYECLGNAVTAINARISWVNSTKAGTLQTALNNACSGEQPLRNWGPADLSSCQSSRNSLWQVTTSPSCRSAGANCTSQNNGLLEQGRDYTFYGCKQFKGKFPDPKHPNRVPSANQPIGMWNG